METMLNCMIHAFHYFAGVTATVLTDNMKTRVTEPRLSEELKALRDAASRLRGQLDAQRQLKGRQQQSLLALEAQRSVCERWNKLRQLIGSADGKKFRNFAQGLTFERMVALANLQLRNLTDRYLLFHDNTQPLELQVVDSYQADQMRSTRNLSGGEASWSA